MRQQQSKISPGNNLIFESMRIILPEHREMLLKYNEEKLKVDKPELDEQEIELLQNKIALAMEYKTNVRIEFWLDGEFHECQGRIVKVDTYNNEIGVKDEFGELQRIRFEYLVGIEEL